MSGVEECEGFICPYCLVSFSQQHQLQQHFVEMHSGLGVVEQDDYDVVEYVEDEVGCCEMYNIQKCLNLFGIYF